jgi:hypothetical protein
MYSLIDLDIDFQRLLIKEDNWPGPVADPKSIYTDFYHDLHSRTNNITCACCGCIEHTLADVEMVPSTEQYLATMTVNLNDVPTSPDFNWRSGVVSLDSQNIMVDFNGILRSQGNSQDCLLTLCKPCHYKLVHQQLPPQALANYRWIGDLPEELRELTWLEEKLLARRHLVGSIVRLEDRYGYMGLKGHMILVPQNTTELVNLLPRPASSLPDMIRVVWTGKNRPKYNESIQHDFTINKQRVYNALVWLMKHNEDYKDVEMDKAEFDRWPSTFIAQNLLNGMGHVMDSSLDDAARSGVATEDLDSSDVVGDMPRTVSGIVDVNNALEPYEIATLNSLTSLTENITINVVTGNTIKSHSNDLSYFTAAFPTLFPYGTGKHKDDRRTVPLSLSNWVRLLLRNSSRYLSLY